MAKDIFAGYFLVIPFLEKSVGMNTACRDTH